MSRAIRKLFKRYKRDAVRKRRIALSFNITYEQFESLIKGNCYYCGEVPKNVFVWNERDTRSGKIYTSSCLYNGIDRLDNDKGYLIENCVSCCTACNRFKGSKSLAELYDELPRLMKFVKKIEALNQGS